MNITICRNEDRIEVQVRNWKENRSRYARVELDILKAVGYMTVDPTDDNGEVIRIWQDKPFGFTRQHIDKIVNVLSGYCLTPSIQL